MCAVRRIYTAEVPQKKPDERYSVRIERGGKPVAGIRSDRISVVDEVVMFWTKADLIHDWFVKNVQSGIDDCSEYLVTSAELIALCDVCRIVLDSVTVDEDGMLRNTHVAKRLLPPRKRFFFGKRHFGRHHLWEVQRTYDWAARMLADKKAGVPGQIYYSSSW